MKSAGRDWLPWLAAQVWLQAAGHGRFTRAFGPGVVLVPVPGSAAAQPAHWVGGGLALCLREVGLAAEVWPILRRRHAVRKSAFAAAGERPSVLEHYASFAVERASWGGEPMVRSSPVREPAGSGLRLTLVDDVITRGRTLLAAAARLQEAFPAAEVRAFALLRTLGRGEMLHRVLDPCEGEVRWECEDARRRP
ncbi:MAG: phosphoribosyltransferase [Gammaproteobacteria bacterium]|nr:phosphoribosyltransferase [Gammaproteobacteria bacterium]